MTSQRGVALILALMVLAFLTVLGGALLTTTTIDIRISDNHKNGVQSLYLAEAGTEQAREFLRASASPVSQLLMAGAGIDGLLATSDDVPLISGDLVGHYDVWLSNDHGDGKTNPVDTNRVLTLVSVGKIGNAQKRIETTVRKATVDLMDPSLTARLLANATNVYNPAPGTAQSITNFGSPGDYQIGVVNGDARLGWGTGYGILLVRGNLDTEGSFAWNGYIVLAPPGGEMRIAEEWMEDDPAAMAAANRLLPYVPIAIGEF
jgi:Tfp pilus assembly protein PilX